MYKLNTFFIKKTAIEKAFLDEKNGLKYLEYFEKNNSKFIKKIPSNAKVIELFTIEKENVIY